MRHHYLISSVINIILTLIEILLSLRLLLRFLGANPSASFVSWIYANTNPLLRPFEGMFPSPTLEGQFTLEFSTIFAFIFYALIGSLILEALAWVTRSLTRH